MSPPADRSPTQLRRAVTSSYLGSVIEYYDFLLYATASAVVFNTVFFPSADPTAGVIASFGTLVAGYAAKPVGAALFGHFGDRLGRKKTLISTLLLMGVATVAIGLLPSAASIGVAAPILLVTLRFLQGLACLEQASDVHLADTGKLIDRPGRDRRFLQALDPHRLLFVALLLKAGGEIVAGGGELVERSGVEAVEFGFFVDHRPIVRISGLAGGTEELAHRRKKHFRYPFG